MRSYRLFGCSKKFVYPEIWRIPCDFFFQLSHHLLSLFVIYTDPVCTDMISSAHRGQPGSLAPSSSSSKRRGKPRTVTASVDRGVGRLGSSDERRDIAKSVTDLGSFGAQVPCTTKADDQRPRRKRAIFALTILYIGILICQMPTHKSKTTTPGQVRAVDLVKYELDFVKRAYYDKVIITTFDASQSQGSFIDFGNGGSQDTCSSGTTGLAGGLSDTDSSTQEQEQDVSSIQDVMEKYHNKVDSGGKLSGLCGEMGELYGPNARPMVNASESVMWLVEEIQKICSKYF